MRRKLLIGFAVMLGLAVVLPNLSPAQNDNTGSAETTKEYRGPLPAHFGKLGMSDTQKEKVYSLQESYEEQLEKLRKQIEQIEQKRDAEIETLLTPGQKLRLQELREEAAKEAAESQAIPNAPAVGNF
ncbi:MAG: hypothetical protein KDA52_01070 [Planctomycetaceae bacterium]|nr:hypothetical protein [Planctomycetaceae bacterium]